VKPALGAQADSRRDVFHRSRCRYCAGSEDGAPRPTATAHRATEPPRGGPAPSTSSITTHRTAPPSPPGLRDHHRWSCDRRVIPGPAAAIDHLPAVPPPHTRRRMHTDLSARSIVAHPLRCHLSQYLAHFGLTIWRSLIELSGVVDRLPSCCRSSRACKAAERTLPEPRLRQRARPDCAT